MAAGCRGEENLGSRLLPGSPSILRSYWMGTAGGRNSAGCPGDTDILSDVRIWNICVMSSRTGE